MSKTISFITANLNNGKVLPMRHSVAKNGNAFWAVLDTKADGNTRFFNGYGVKVNDKVVGDVMPTTVEVCGKEFPIQVDKTEKGQLRGRASGVVDVPNVGCKRFALRITVVGTAQFNIAASVFGDGTPKEPKAKPAKKDPYVSSL